MTAPTEYSPAAAVEADVENSLFSMEYRKPAYPVTIMMPYVDGIRGPVVASMLYYAKHLDVGFELVGNTLLSTARNELADRFLKSKALWSFWLDSDVFIPFGNAGAFLNYTQATKGHDFVRHNALVRMIKHDQPLVGGVYAGRFKGAPLTIQPDLYPRNRNDQQMSQALRNGNAAGGLQAVEWIAAGLMLVHRYVFERIMETQPIEPPFPGAFYPFFTQFGALGEDVAFCERAKRAGIHPFLDTEVRAGHIGLSVFMPEDSRPAVPMRGRPSRESDQE